ncbi:alpha/beta fold hydrolase [Poritiphilus flavus]|uniref:Alpha/beta fold hydrolase n=1 Tax=Poritiphilus flavus TaxID=2697053 RepID=A0A6L9EGC3_9FLAO|nr:alpha/beta hydrolase [Poritiphilus flavus]NAS13713.1 alpha/beta fold hydrolase [Poritiphilus flavus]
MKTINIKINGENLVYYDSEKGDTTLLFIHGAFINKEYWNEQLSHFSKTYRVLAVDLAGHGNSSHYRTDWTVQEYGRDISEFIKKLSLRNVVLIGHSFGSDVMLETVALDPAQIIGLIEVDHMKSVGVEVPQETIEHLIANLRTDFANTCEQFARQALLSEGTDPGLVARLLKDYREMNPEVGIPLIENTFTYTKRETELLRGLNLKLHLIHVDYMPTSEENLRKYLAGNYQLHKISGSCHYPMLENPIEFNVLLEQILSTIEDKQR